MADRRPLVPVTSPSKRKAEEDLLLAAIRRKRELAKLPAAERYAVKAREAGLTKETIEQDVSDLEGVVHLRQLAPGTERLQAQAEIRFTTWLQLAYPQEWNSYLPAQDVSGKGKAVLKQLSDGESSQPSLGNDFGLTHSYPGEYKAMVESVAQTMTGRGPDQQPATSSIINFWGHFRGWVSSMVLCSAAEYTDLSVMLSTIVRRCSKLMFLTWSR